MKYRVLGPIELETSAGLIRIHSSCIQSMLATLLMSPRQVVPVERIIDDMWPEQPPRSAVENVRTYVYQLRRLLDSHGRHSILKSVPGGYQFDIDLDELDLTHFLRLAGEGHRALRADDHVQAAARLNDALQLWRAAPLSGLSLSRAMRAKTVALEEQHSQVQVDWIQARIGLNEAADVIVPLRGLLAERPLDERLWCLLMRSLAFSGRLSESLAVFDEARRTLAQELGSEPGPELRALHADLLRGDLAPPPEQPAQAVERGQVPHQLPASTRQLVGRHAELGLIDDLARQVRSGELNHPATVLVSGMPGVGKTALAVTAVERLREFLPDGELYLNLSDWRGKEVDPWGAMSRMLDAFGVPAGSIPQSADSRRSLYRSVLAERCALVVIDGARDDEQVAPLIPGPGRSMVLVTSRRRLTRIYADLRINLDVLGTEDALTLLANMIGAERVAAEPEAAGAVVTACGGLPAVLRVAGARLASRAAHPIQVLAERLRDGESLLDEFSLDGFSVRDEFDRSYYALSPQLRRHFRAVGALPPEAISAAAVGRVAHTSALAADRVLEALTSEGMLAAQLSETGTPSYRLPVVLHAYARERLAREGLAAGLSSEEPVRLTG